ncbi:hypothetical protein G7Y31_11465 [Corynebacterium lizhenjunii]|uniref:Uncharacterized protein n=1 Tax=Corynebacterium lizhenjunii TaxID=2709394 RepID=A0A7T0KFG2_9CORY|nr:hypothetical protein [Corynebacterium lizhenjunii]QPK79089.1 hypothetical protein G7Y31_11465 [Corynebacterium lizhenjunii]
MENAHTIHFCLEDDSIDIGRFVVVAADATVGEIVLTAHAALGLDPSRPGTLLVAPEFSPDPAGDTPIQVLDVMDEPGLEFFFARGGIATYQPSVGQWGIIIRPLDVAYPMCAMPHLVDATGPDLLPAAESVEGMAALLGMVRMLLTGLDLEPEAREQLNSVFPNYPLEQIRTRLTECYPPAIAQRLQELSEASLSFNS